MLQVLSLRLEDGPGVGWSERVSRYVSLSLDVVRDGVDECLVVVGKMQDNLAVRRHQCGVLAIDDSGGLVAVLVYDNVHALVRKDGRAASHCRTGNVAEGLLASKELFHDDLVDPLGCGPEHGHDGGLGVATEGAVDFVILETSSGTEDETLLELGMFLVRFPYKIGALALHLVRFPYCRVRFPYCRVRFPYSALSLTSPGLMWNALETVPACSPLLLHCVTLIRFVKE